MGRTLSEAEVAEIERHHGVDVPIEFRGFVQVVGNGCPVADLELERLAVISAEGCRSRPERSPLLIARAPC